jgi:hypothetical protein
MSVVITDNVSSVGFTFSNGEEIYIDKDQISIKKHGGIFSREMVYITNGKGFIKNADTEVIRLHYTDVSSPSLASNAELVTLLLGYKVASGAIMGSVQITDGTNSVSLEPNGSLPVTLQDQTTPTVIAHMSILEQTTTTTGAVAIGDYVLPVTSVTGISAGKLLSIFDPTSIRFAQAFVISVTDLNVTIDRPIDFAYPSGSYVDVSESNLAVNGSSTPVVAGLRNNAGATPPPGINLSMDVTRIMFHCVATSSCDLTTFGNLSALTNGITFRRRNVTYHNIFNCKTNGELRGIMYDFEIVATGTIGQGEDGFFGRLTFAGQNKMGVTIRIGIDEDIELLIQDNLSTLTLFEVVAEGSIVQP